ncbi:hypothetical protein GGX14DRAFT_406126 [Mycena pura]|uniref:Uncharacterized protein n=1 Tax=Mycena pura TaxID=153505 RepID=A0AAD6USN6_9AGAR|nr:hypothetical protein GGX14DRAFT_406126 [Mycena pura]
MESAVLCRQNEEKHFVARDNTWCGGKSPSGSAARPLGCLSSERAGRVNSVCCACGSERADQLRKREVRELGWCERDADGRKKDNGGSGAEGCGRSNNVLSLSEDTCKPFVPHVALIYDFYCRARFGSWLMSVVLENYIKFIKRRKGKRKRKERNIIAPYEPLFRAQFCPREAPKARKVLINQVGIWRADVGNQDYVKWGRLPKRDKPQRMKIKI